VPGLDADTLLAKGDIEMWVFVQDWGPILALPTPPTSSRRFHDDEGAFNTVDWERYAPAFDKAAYKIEKLRERLRSVTIDIDIVKRRLPEDAKYLVLHLLRLGIIDDAHIISDDMQALARLTRTARQLQQEIIDIQASRKQRDEAALERALAQFTGD